MREVPTSAELSFSTSWLTYEVRLHLHSCGSRGARCVDDKLDPGVCGQPSAIDAGLEQLILH
jgi:hypothetical protein